MTSSSLHIRTASPTEIGHAFNVHVDAPVHGYIGEVDGVPVGAGGLTWFGGRAWIFFMANLEAGTFPLPVARMTKRMIAMAGALGADKVYVARDERFSTSAKLLKVMGFEPTGEVHQGHEVYVTHVRP